jgi:hypothetical protein
MKYKNLKHSKKWKMENDNLSMPPAILLEIQNDVKAKNRIININNIIKSTNDPILKLEDHPEYRKYAKLSRDIIFDYEVVDKMYSYKTDFLDGLLDKYKII